MSDQETRDRRKQKRDYRRKHRIHKARQPRPTGHHSVARGDNVFHDPSDPYEPLDFHDEQE